MDIFKSDIIFYWYKILKYFNDFYSGIFPFHCHGEHKQVK